MMFHATRLMMIPAVAAAMTLAPSGALAQGDISPEARAIFDKSAEAIRGVGSFSYTGRFYSEGPPAQFEYRAEVVLVRTGTEAEVPPHSIKGSATLMGMTRDFNVSTDGRVIMWPEPSESILYERPVFERRNAGFEMVQTGRVLRLENLLRAEPYSGELFPTNVVKVNGREVFDGVECDVIEIVSAPPQGGMTATTTWYIGVADHLPRKRHQITRGTGDQAGLSLTVTTELLGLKTGDLTAVDMIMPTPEGYTRAAWTDPRDATKNDGTPDDGVVPVATGPAVGQPAPALKIDLVGGESFDLSTKNGRCVVVTFIDPRLLPSIRVAQTLDAIARDFTGKPVDVLVLSAREPGEKAVQMLRENNIKLPLGVDAAALATQYNVRGFPTTVLIDARGNVAAVEVGLDEQSRMDRRLRVMLDRLTR